jgi:hypothetical protein
MVKRTKMNKRFVLVLIGCVIGVLSSLCVAEVDDKQAASRPSDLPQASIPAFPGAEGAGAFTAGGRGGKVYVVTTLEDYDPNTQPPISGSFRAAAEATEPRIIVFAVAGLITLKAPVNINSPYVTLAGQSAAGDGVCIRGESVLLNTHDVVIRYMRFRRGNLERRDDALGGHPVGNIIIDHVSASWGLDENLSIYRHVYHPADGGKTQKLPTVNVTIQWMIISEALNPFHHAFGGTWGGKNTSFHHNLFACNTGRNPSIGMTYDFNFVDNVVFNWQHRTGDGGDEGSLGNFINNYYKPGPAVHNGPVQYRIVRPDGKKYPHGTTLPSAGMFGQWYVAGNVVEGNEKVTADNWAGGVQFGGSHTPQELQQIIQAARVDKPLPMAPLTIQPAQEAYERVLAGAGATRPMRDAVDRRIIEEVRTGKVTFQDGIIIDPQQVGGWPEYKSAPAPLDSDGDGMPDAWEEAHGLNPHDASDAAGDKDNDGYTNIEEYLNGTDPDVFVDYKDPNNNVNTLKAAP